MIVDDEYVILGSANINQRSMDGSRDTEIAMGAYQPHRTWARKGSHPHGQVCNVCLLSFVLHLQSIYAIKELPNYLLKPTAIIHSKGNV